MAESQIDAISEQVRQLLQPTPVKYHHVPKWLRLRLLQSFGKGAGTTKGSSLLFIAHHETLVSTQWLDHDGSTTLIDGTRAYVSEPYDFNWAAAKAVQAFCERLGLNWVVEANSEWYPGRTLRIVITEPRKAQYGP